MVSPIQVIHHQIQGLKISLDQNDHYHYYHTLNFYNPGDLYLQK